MLIQTVSCDSGLQLDVACDGCGAWLEMAEPPAEAGALARILSQAGWVQRPASTAPSHRCPSCGPAAQ